MKFNVELEIEILNDELLEIINNYNDVHSENDVTAYTTIEEISENEILEILKKSEYINEEIQYYYEDFSSSKISIIK